MASMHPNILVVDDNTEAADLLAEILALYGMVTHTAYGGIEALRAVTELHPDALLLDLGMPNVDGFAVAEALSELAAAPRLIAFSAWDDAATRARTKAAGFDAHLRKPSSIDAIVATIHATVGALPQ